jgi:NADH-quinone oxidoreductase subunit L
MTIEPMLVGRYFGSSIVVAPSHPAIDESVPRRLARHRRVHASRRHALPFWLALAGIGARWYCISSSPRSGDASAGAGPLYTLLDNKYYFDRFNEWFFAGGAARVRHLSCSRGATGRSSTASSSTARAKLIGWCRGAMRHIQSGYVYHYAFTMIVGVFALLTW